MHAKDGVTSGSRRHVMSSSIVSPHWLRPDLACLGLSGATSISLHCTCTRPSTSSPSPPPPPTTSPHPSIHFHLHLLAPCRCSCESRARASLLRPGSAWSSSHLSPHFSSSISILALARHGRRRRRVQHPPLPGQPPKKWYALSPVDVRRMNAGHCARFWLDEHTFSPQHQWSSALKEHVGGLAMALLYTPRSATATALLVTVDQDLESPRSWAYFAPLPETWHR